MKADHRANHFDKYVPVGPRKGFAAKNDSVSQTKDRTKSAPKAEQFLEHPPIMPPAAMLSNFICKPLDSLTGTDYAKDWGSVRAPGRGSPGRGTGAFEQKSPQALFDVQTTGGGGGKVDGVREMGNAFERCLNEVYGRVKRLIKGR